MPQEKLIFITPMQAAHLEALVALEAECFSSPWSYAGLAEELENPLAVFLVALWEGEIAGYVGMTQVLDEGYLLNLAVTSRFRRHGVASALLKALLCHAKAEKLCFVTLEVRPSNLAARRLYERFGFQAVGSRRNFYKNPTEDALLLTKTF